MIDRIARTGAGLLTAALFTGPFGVLAANAANLSGAGRSLTYTVGVSQDATIANFTDALAARPARAVDSVFQDLLGRTADPAGLELYTPLAERGGTAAVVGSVLDSAEYRTHLVRGWYQDLLGRTPADAELQPLIDALQDGTRDEVVLAGIVGSDEYFDANGATNAAFVDALYQDLLDRPADPGASQLVSLIGLITRTQLATYIINGTDYRTHTVTTYYRRFLGREPSANEVTPFVTQLANGATHEQIIAILVGSAEYDSGIPAPQYSASIDWGDGEASSAQVVPNATGGFDVGAAHTFAKEGNFSIRIDITDGLGETLALSSSASVPLPVVPDVVPPPATPDDVLPVEPDVVVPTPDDVPPVVPVDVPPADQDDPGQPADPVPNLSDTDAGDNDASVPETPNGDPSDQSPDQLPPNELVSPPPLCGFGASLSVPLTLSGLGLLRCSRRRR